MTKDDHKTWIREEVYRALDAACVQGYGPELRALSNEKIAVDLLDLDADFEVFSMDDLLPAIRAYRTERWA